MSKIKRFISPHLLSLLAGVCLCNLLSGVVHADIAIIVHPQNPLAALNESDVRRIYMGRMRMFPDSSQGIEAIDLPESAERFVVFYQSLMHLNPAKLKRQRASYLFSGKGRLPVVMETDEAVKVHVAKTPAAIGYVESGWVDGTVKVVATVKTE